MDKSFSYSEFEPKYIESLARDYGKYDTNGDGRLDRTEFVKWLVAGGVKEKTAKDMFFVADSDNDGSISLDEFKAYAQLQQNMILKDDIEPYARNIYNAIKARSGNNEGLNKKEFLKFMDLMNMHVKLSKKSKTFKSYDFDGSGTVEFDEIMRQIEYKRSTLLDTNE